MESWKLWTNLSLGSCDITQRLESIFWKKRIIANLRDDSLRGEKSFHALLGFEERKTLTISRIYVKTFAAYTNSFGNVYG